MNLKLLAILASVSLLAACSSGSSLLNGKSSVPRGYVAVGNPLALPPDLSLPAPGTGPDPAAFQAPAPAAAISARPIASNTGLYGTAAGTPALKGDVFEQNGISKTKPDGTKKTAAELNAELSAIYIKKKRQQNPSYGTVGNIGAIFSDN